jgi:hypothetical protein
VPPKKKKRAKERERERERERGMCQEWETVLSYYCLRMEQRKNEAFI